MNTQLIEAARLALEALYDSVSDNPEWIAKRERTVAALRAALEQLAQDEPVALETVYETIIQWDEGGGKRSRRELARRIVALYTRPQAREPLTDEEIHAIYDEVARREPYGMATTRRNIARAIEAAHGIKENT